MNQVDLLNQFLRAAGIHEEIRKHHSVAGGCINTTVYVQTSNQEYFIKYRSAAGDLFEKERLGLIELKNRSPLRVPNVCFCGHVGEVSFLILEWVSKGAASGRFWENFGHQLAAQHQVTQAKFGWIHDNHIGRLAQSNTPTNSWVDFFIRERLEPQVKMALANGWLHSKHQDAFEKLYLNLDTIFPQEPPALLHGDLWSGNFLTSASGEAVLVDPAVYYGHREMEIAFTQMFGGFDSQFYDAYQEVFPLAPGFSERVALNQLYPYLVHVNLFGAGYLSGVEHALAPYL